MSDTVTNPLPWHTIRALGSREEVLKVIVADRDYSAVAQFEPEDEAAANLVVNKVNEIQQSFDRFRVRATELAFDREMEIEKLRTRLECAKGAAFAKKLATARAQRDELCFFARRLVNLADNMLAFYEYRVRYHKPSQDFIAVQRDLLDKARIAIRNATPGFVPAVPGILDNPNDTTQQPPSHEKETTDPS